MNSKLLNALIALIEDRPEIARQFLRAPGVEIGSVTEVQARVQSALERTRCQAVRMAVRQLLMASMRLEAPEGADPKYAEAFIAGVSAVEDLLDRVLTVTDKEESKLDAG